MKENLTKQEWILMETLWKNYPLFLSDIMKQTNGRVNWTKSTYSTYLKKMTEDGLIGYETVRGSRLYAPLVSREACMVKESRSLLSRMSEDSTLYFVTNMIREGSLSKEDRQELRNLIDELGKNGDSTDAEK